ncbi:hypothetical protein [Companilactobacillus zhongbaensis]|uniref:hypothetical protein n=1 Tax=Companilactobacillus zhongbaensis TaxID=2486009 RepID=UPI000F7BA77D|nr:hypothetical protein [Companilactobacillus zhongbaensis]
MGLFSRKKQERDPADNDFSKISQEIKKSPQKLSQAQRLFKNDLSRRVQATGKKDDSDKQ